MSKTKKILIIIYATALILLVSVIYIVPSVTGKLTPTEILQYGSLQVTDDALCYFSRDEIVYLAGETGNINYYIEQDTHIRSGAKILEILPAGIEQEVSAYSGIIAELASNAIQTQNYISDKNGVVSYYVDGYEAYFSPDNLKNIKYHDIENFQIQITNLTRTGTIAGEPLYKICDNNTWYLMCWVAPGEISKYQVGKNVKIQLPLGEITAKVESLIDEGDKWKLIFSTDRYYEDFSIIRRADARIITEDYNGILIPNKSITAENGQVGVYVKSKSGEYSFKPIKVYISDGEYSIAEPTEYYDSDGNRIKTVNIYDEILKNPSR